MKKRIPVAVTVTACILCTVITFQITYGVTNSKYRKNLQKLSEEPDLVMGLDESASEKLNKVADLYSRYYIGDLDNEDLSDGILYGYVAGSRDAHGYYLDRNDFSSNTADSEAAGEGIGVTVAMTEDGLLYIYGVAPSSPAKEAGVMEGDTIIAVGNEKVADIGYEKAVEKLVGKEGTVAEFTVRRGIEDKSFSITRKPYTTQSVYCRRYDEDNNIAIVEISDFDDSTAEQFINIIDGLEKDGISGIVFDLRGNPGGNMEAVVKVLDRLLPEGPILKLIDANKKETVISTEAGELNLPMTVLVNKKTASAAELFSVDLRDIKKVKLIGENTYGKGTGQTIFDLGDGTGIGISTVYYSSPLSDNYEGIGLKPDIEIALDEKAQSVNLHAVSDTVDNQLVAAVEELKKEIK